MRPLRLRLRAFGPFPAEESVDFTELDGAGLLLLHGRTGAGKTSLLDALGYTLYGVVPGERGIKGLRSEHADPAQETFVELEFLAAGRRLRIGRTPKQEIAKKRGEGVTTRQPRGHLEEWDGAGWRSVSTRLDEIGQEMGRLLGLTAEQFFQVVLLPQGRFADFLRAPAADRERLLRSLFGTERFARVEDALSARRRDLGEQVDRLRHRRDQLLDSLFLELGGPPEDGAELTADGIAGRLPVLGAEQESIRAAVAHAARAVRCAADQLAETRSLADRQRRRAAAEGRRAELAMRGAERDRLRDELEAARRAAPLLGDVRRCERLTADAEAAEQRLRERASALPADVTVAAAGEDEERAARDEVARLEALLPDEASLARDTQTAQLLRQRGEEAAQRVREARAACERRRAAVQAGRAAAAEVVAAGERAEEAERQREGLRQRREAAAGLAARRGELAGAEAAVAAAREHALAEREAWLDVVERRLAGMAGELAARLVPGEPCGVCGSPSHPAPAARAATEATAEEEKAARVRHERAEQALDEARRRREALHAEVNALVVTAGTAEPDLEALDAALVDAEARAAAAHEQLSALRAQAGTVTADEEALAAEERVLATAEAAAAGAAESAAQAAGQLDERRRRLRAAVGEDGALTDRIERYHRRAEALARYREAATAHTRAVAERDAAQAHLAQTCRAAGFAETTALAAAGRDGAEILALEDAGRAYDTQVAEVHALLAQPDLCVALDPPADLDQAEQTVADARHEHERLVEQRADLRGRLERGEALHAELVLVDAELAPVARERQLVHGLAELASGGAGNRLNMSLSAFVLAARLEAVAQRASVRLSRMTSGRYTLAHTDEVVDGRRRSGLGLAVRDLWTGSQRPTSSLSGGETFMTSLALALGLADVVAEEAGGLRIDTLFVDEGFGTLDEQTLDQVMEVLDGLREGGRLVGIVSHVGELQRRVPARIEVIRAESGSTVRTHAVPAHA